MRGDLFVAHLAAHKCDRREALGMAAGAGAAGVLAGLGLRTTAAEASVEAPEAAPAQVPKGRFDDEMFDVQAVLRGAWDNTRFYRRGDQRGTLREVTPRKTARALRLLDDRRPVRSYQLGDRLFNGYPAFGTRPPRQYNQRLVVGGYQPPAGFEGFLQSATPSGPNQVSVHEERFASTPGSAPYGVTYQIATQLDNLNHIGVGPVFYGGHRGPQIAETWGTSRLGVEHAGPIVTRGILLDVLGVKRAQGASDVIEEARNGRPHLASTYRITIEDLEAAMRRARIRRIERGDAVLIRTGWNQLVNPKDPAGAHAPDDAEHPGHPEHQKYLRSEPGIYLREARWLAEHRPALVGADTWALEVLGNPVSGENAFPVHQELIVHYGVRIGEGIVSDGLADDGIYEFVYINTPQNATGATAGNAPPAALGQRPRRRRRR